MIPKDMNEEEFTKKEVAKFSRWSPQVESDEEFRQRLLSFAKCAIQYGKDVEKRAWLDFVPPETLAVRFYIRDDNNQIEQLVYHFTFNILKHERITWRLFEEVVAQFVTDSRIFQRLLSPNNQS